MNIHRFTICLSLVLAVGLSACSSTRKSATVPERPQAAKIRKDYLKPTDVRRVRTGEFVKTYHVGRSVGGRNGSTMHEAHRVYRLEKPSRWNLARDQPPLASTGPVNRIVDTAFMPPPESQAIRAELNRQRDAAEGLEHARDEMRLVVANAKAKLSEASKNAAAVASLKIEIEQLKRENEALRKARGSKSTSVEATPEKPSDALRRWGAGLDAESKDSGSKDGE